MLLYVMMIVLFFAFQLNAKEFKSVNKKTKSIEEVKPVPVGGTLLDTQ